ncbi:hypothetical protein [Streptomyces albireticuli]|uniref:hypothetical protein n=1 Tax=Streptomyces albireticuli TaxID=1940 RepID=UPI001180B107|nr:hypothetical protein [Streptomyces albireticuli]MCD9141732.1 hypothetical protein [Streptomyces albireticuli]MCD9165904.1 hypothetical protein [Streptomyces albireticuli]MCD9189906.1 hypothetical protein [Streptomyces albireticuli]
MWRSRSDALNRAALVTSVAGAAVAVAGALLLLGGGHDEGGPATRLVTPPAVADGAYRLVADTEALEKEGITVQPGMPEGTVSVLARYARADDPKATLSLSGAYGRVGGPEAVLDGMLKGLEEGPGSPAVVSARRVLTPDGPRGPSLTCEVVRLDGGAYAPACAWAEKSDAALLISFDPRKTSASAVDETAFAKVTATVYRDVRRTG